MRRRRRQYSPKITRALLSGALVALLSAVIWSLIAPAGVGQPQSVQIDPGDSVGEAARTLADQGLIRNPTTLTAAAYLTGKWRRVQAGEHEIAPSMNALEVLHALSTGSRKTWKQLTIPEGYTIRQVAQAAEEAGITDADDFMLAAQDLAPVSGGFPLPPGNLEGYLFPDTYRISPQGPPTELITAMLARFEEVVWKGIFQEDPAFQSRSLNDVIILASLVEAEAKQDGDRDRIAGVLMNRLRRGQRLECDATVQYALGDGRKARLRYNDLRIDSEYNTYLHEGLPPGPICSPGVASIEAAMIPAEVPYLYYVARPDGSHVFSRTLAEHRAAAARIRRKG